MRRRGREIVQRYPQVPERRDLPTIETLFLADGAMADEPEEGLFAVLVESQLDAIDDEIVAVIGIRFSPEQLTAERPRSPDVDRTDLCPDLLESLQVFLPCPLGVLS